MTATIGLIEQYRAGDADALNQLYGRYTERVLAIVRARLGAKLRQRVQSMDIVQEAMLASFKNLEQFDYSNASEGAFLNWLTKIVENRIRDQHDYHTAAQRNIDKESPLENPRSGDSSGLLKIVDPSGASTASNVIEDMENMLRMEQALDRLPAESRELIITVELEGRTYQELAKEMDKTYDAVRMLVKRAMKSLSAVYRELEGEGAAT